MSPKETAIAEAAIKASPATEYREVHAQIATATGYSVAEVEAVITHLTKKDFILCDCVTPALNRSADPDAPKQIIKAWYEKGEMWVRPE
jgi:hypothetical protein